MKKCGNVRIESIAIKNFKNISDGEVFFNEYKKVERNIYDKNEVSSLLGIYGQNGSGKTTIIEALRIVQIFLSSGTLFLNSSDYVKYGENASSISVNFIDSFDGEDYLVEYKVELSKSSFGNECEISKEKLSYSSLSDEEHKKNNAFSFESPNKINKSFLDSLGDSTLKANYMFTVANETKPSAISAAISSIFNVKLLNLVFNSKKKDELYWKIVTDLCHFARSCLAIYSINYFNANDNLGIRFRMKKETEILDESYVGDCFVPFNGMTLSTKIFNDFKEVINKINRVMPSIIPEYNILIKNEKAAIDQFGNPAKNFVLFSSREGKEIPLFYESNGIKKIISVLSGLIDAFNNEGSFIAIDEIDSGIFEYLLGEIIYAFDNFASGQMLFTSHNMRILEKINYKNIFFTTANENKRFIRMSDVRENHNLRNLYYRYIANGYKDGTKLYDNIKTDDMITSFFMKD